jgi:hypothetical protein
VKGGAGDATGPAAPDGGRGELRGERGVVGEGTVGDRRVESRDVGDRKQVEIEPGVGERAIRGERPLLDRLHRPRVGYLELGLLRGQVFERAVGAAFLGAHDQRRDRPAQFARAADGRDQVSTRGRSGPVCGSQQRATELAGPGLLQKRGAGVGALEPKEQHLVDELLV